MTPDALAEARRRAKATKQAFIFIGVKWLRSPKMGERSGIIQNRKRGLKSGLIDEGQ
jgi:hypothetical protein